MYLPATNKSLGQHWLTDEFALQSMCNAANVMSEDTVLEIGPGLGTLTELLVAQAGRVVAVEFDEKLATGLPKRVKAENLTVSHCDILKFDLTTLPANYKVVANIPYYLTSKLLRVLSESTNPPAAVALLVQKEVAERVAAQPGDMSLLSVSVQWYFAADLQEVVPARLFTPPPKVDSQIIQLVRREEPLFAGVNTAAFFRLVKAGFSARRKTLHNSLAAGLRMPKDTVSKLLVEAKIEPRTRPQELSLTDWHRLYEAVAHNDPSAID